MGSLAFCLFDRNHAGAISVPEFRKIIVSLDIATDPEKIDAIVESVDSNKDNVIDFREFATAMIRHLPPASEEEDYRSSNKRISFYDDLELIECFQAFDKNGDGFISQSELEEVMVSLGERLTPKEIRAMMEEADTNGDGLIDLEEFKQLLPM